MASFLPFFIVLFAAVVFSQLFSRMRIPWVVALIAGGIIIGPSGLGLFEPDVTIDFLAHVGLVFLMFMAGLESQFSRARGAISHIAITAALVGIVPTLVGISIGFLFGYPWPTAVLLGIIFMSSAIALLIPQLQAQKILGSDLGKVLLGAAIVIDALSLVLLSVFLQVVGGAFSPWVFVLYPVLFVVFAGLIWIIPKIRWIAFSEEYPEQQDLFEKELRFIILVLVGSVVIFNLVGLHSIIAGFFAGLALSRSLQSRLLKAKLHAISYGFFVPVFFVVVGANTSLSVFVGGLGAALLAVIIVVGLVVSKFASGWAAARLCGFTDREGAFLGVAVTPQLSTALAVAFLGFGQGILDDYLLSSIVALTVVTSIFAPIAVNRLGRDLTTQQVTIPEAAKDAEPPLPEAAN